MDQPADGLLTGRRTQNGRRSWSISRWARDPADGCWQCGVFSCVSARMSEMCRLLRAPAGPPKKYMLDLHEYRVHRGIYNGRYKLCGSESKKPQLLCSLPCGPVLFLPHTFSIFRIPSSLKLFILTPNIPKSSHTTYPSRSICSWVPFRWYRDIYITLQKLSKT